MQSGPTDRLQTPYKGSPLLEEVLGCESGFVFAE